MKRLFLGLIPIAGLLSCSNELEETQGMSSAMCDGSISLSVGDTSNRLTSTRWGQSYPWNVYVPFVSGSTTVHCVAGCAAVAAAQYLYYLHYKNNKPASTVTTATYSSASNQYSYTGSSSTVWNQMAKTTSDSGTNYAAVLIGYAGKSVNMEYGGSASGAYFSDVVSFINDKGGYNYKVNSIDYSYVTGELQAGRAVLADAVTKDSKGNDVGHQFIIDRYRKTTTTSTSTFGWIGTDNLGQDSNERDESGNIVGYSFFYDRTNETNVYDYTMNWGWNGLYDNTYCNASGYSNWNVNVYQFDTSRRIAKQ